MKAKHILFLLFFIVSIHLLAGPPSIETNIYPTTKKADFQLIMNFLKEKNGEMTIDTVYKNGQLESISGTISFKDGIKQSFSSKHFERIHITRTFGNDNQIIIDIKEK